MVLFTLYSLIVAKYAQHNMTLLSSIIVSVVKETLIGFILTEAELLYIGSLLYYIKTLYDYN